MGNQKKNAVDFALWKKASQEHIIDGLHHGLKVSRAGIECSMSTKYLGKRFDIHGGGMDLVFPHHEAEIAQSCASDEHDAVNYWMHNYHSWAKWVNLLETLSH